MGNFATLVSWIKPCDRHEPELSRPPVVLFPLSDSSPRHVDAGVHADESKDCPPREVLRNTPKARVDTARIGPSGIELVNDDAVDLSGWRSADHSCSLAPIRVKSSCFTDRNLLLARSCSPAWGGDQLLDTTPTEAAGTFVERERLTDGTRFAQRTTGRQPSDETERYVRSAVSSDKLEPL